MYVTHGFCYFLIDNYYEYVIAHQMQCIYIPIWSNCTYPMGNISIPSITTTADYYIMTGYVSACANPCSNFVGMRSCNFFMLMKLN